MKRNNIIDIITGILIIIVCSVAINGGAEKAWFGLTVGIGYIIYPFTKSWSKVQKGKKPIGWWYHKIMCEFGWAIRKYNSSQSMYYKHLNKMCDKYHLNLYGVSTIYGKSKLPEATDIDCKIAIGEQLKQMGYVYSDIQNIQTYKNNLEAKKRTFELMPEIIKRGHKEYNYRVWCLQKDSELNYKNLGHEDKVMDFMSWLELSYLYNPNTKRYNKIYGVKDEVPESEDLLTKEQLFKKYISDTKF